MRYYTGKYVCMHSRRKEIGPGKQVASRGGHPTHGIRTGFSSLRRYPEDMYLPVLHCATNSVVLKDFPHQAPKPRSL